MELTDEKVAEKVQHGDIDAFGILVNRYETKLIRYASKFLSSHEDMKDVVQEVFIKAYVNIKSFDKKKKFSPWIYRIAHNEYINTLKKKNRLTYVLTDFETDTFFPHPASLLTPEIDAEKKFIKEILDKCLDELDHKYKEPLILSYFDELNYEEISEVLHIPVSTVGVRLQRGKARLRLIYEKKYGAFK